MKSFSCIVALSLLSLLRASCQGPNLSRRVAKDYDLEQPNDTEESCGTYKRRNTTDTYKPLLTTVANEADDFLVEQKINPKSTSQERNTSEGQGGEPNGILGEAAKHAIVDTVNAPNDVRIRKRSFIDVITGGVLKLSTGKATNDGDKSEDSALDGLVGTQDVQKISVNSTGEDAVDHVQPENGEAPTSETAIAGYARQRSHDKLHQDVAETSEPYEDVEPRVVAVKIKHNAGVPPMTIKVGALKVTTMPMGSTWNMGESFDGADGQGTRGGIMDNSPEAEALKLDNPNDEVIITKSGIKRRVDEVFSLHRSRYVYVSTHAQLWQKILPIGGHRIEDENTAAAMIRLRDCFGSRRPIILDNVNHIVVLEGRINKAISTLNFRLGLSVSTSAVQSAYYRIHKTFSDVLTKATAYFRAITALVDHFLVEYRTSARQHTHYSTFFIPIRAQNVNHEIDRCLHDDSYGTFTSIRSCLQTWELATMADIFEIEALVDRMWLSRLETEKEEKTAAINNVMDKIVERIEAPTCLQRLQYLEYERQIKAALMQLGLTFE